MNIQEKCTKLLNELLDGIDNGDFSDANTIPEQYTYAHLYALLYFQYTINGFSQLYEQLYDSVMHRGKSAIQEKVKLNKKIKVAFLAISAAEWPAEDVYRFFESDKRCECYIVVCPLMERDKYNMEQLYLQTCEYLEQSGHEVRRSYDVEKGLHIGWDAIGGIPDILIHLTSWYQALPEEYQLENLPLKCINCYIPYAMYTVDSLNGDYMRNVVYNNNFINMMWRVYTDSKKNLEGYCIHELLHGKNILYSGYAKMDYFFQTKEYHEMEILKIWKIPQNADIRKIKKVIIAPHHSFINGGLIVLSTFARNMYFWLYLAQKYADKVSFILKPHPSWGTSAVRHGIFEDIDAYEAYLNTWNSFPNAKVVQEEDYHDIFATSDGMIMDSGSFLAEYMYVGKPLLFLTRKEQAFSTLGQEVLKGYYTEPGENYIGIENFLKEVILDGKDTLAEMRKEIFDKELNYYKENHRFASENIYTDISELLKYPY